MRKVLKRILDYMLECNNALNSTRAREIEEYSSYFEITNINYDYSYLKKRTKKNKNIEYI